MKTEQIYNIKSLCLLFSDSFLNFYGFYFFFGLCFCSIFPLYIINLFEVHKVNFIIPQHTKQCLLGFTDQYFGEGEINSYFSWSLLLYLQSTYSQQLYYLMFEYNILIAYIKKAKSSILEWDYCIYNLTVVNINKLLCLISYFLIGRVLHLFLSWSQNLVWTTTCFLPSTNLLV